MTTMIKNVLYSFIFLIFTSCSGFAIEEKLLDNYYLIAGDISEDCSLSYKVSDDDFGTVIGATVFAIGYDKQFIIAKQYPRTFPNPPNKKVINYYILPIKRVMNWKNKNGLVGPLSYDQFVLKRKELKLNDELKFTKEIEDLK